MARERITAEDVEREFYRLTNALRRVRGDKVTAVLHHGNKSHKVANKLVVIIPHGSGSYSTQVWPDTMAGYTTRDAYNALRLMAAALSLTD